MANLNIDLDGSIPDFQFQIELENVLYTMRFSWNIRSSVWGLQISDQSGNTLLGHTPVVVNAPLIGRFNNPSLPPGELWAWDSSGDGEEISAMADLGDRVLFMYVESGTDETAAAG